MGLVGAVLTYVAVGDRMFAACAPAAHGGMWRGVAGFLAKTLAPFFVAACCLACLGRRLKGLLEVQAVGILRRLEDMEEERKKAHKAHSALVAPPREPQAEEGPISVVSPLHAGGPAAPAPATSLESGTAPLATPGTPLATTGTGVPDNSAQALTVGVWKMHSDETDVWFSNSVTGQVVWALPEGAVAGMDAKG